MKRWLSEWRYFSPSLWMSLAASCFWQKPLKIPTKSVELRLKELADNGVLIKDGGSYVANPEIFAESLEDARHVRRMRSIILAPPRGWRLEATPPNRTIKVRPKAKLSDYQRQETIKRRAAGETLASIAKSYAVDISMISRL